jgi:PKD repeat protein
MFKTLYMKHLKAIGLFTMMLIGFNTLLLAQVKVKHVGETLIIENGTDVFIKGSLQSAVDTIELDFIGNLGNIYLSDSLINTGENNVFGDYAAGNIHFNGNTKQFIVGTDTINFFNAEINNTGDTVILYQIVTHFDSILEITAGNVNLLNSEIALDLYGHLQNETNSKRIMGYLGELTLQRPISSNVMQTNLAGIGFDAEFSGNPGVVKVIRVNAAHSLPANGSVARSYTIIPTTNGGNVKNLGTNYFDSNELAGQNEDSLNSYISLTNGNKWRDKEGARNTSTDEVVSSSAQLFPLNVNPSDYTLFTLAEDSCEKLPFVDILRDTIAMCSGENAWLYADGTEGVESFWSTGESNTDSVSVAIPNSYYYLTVLDIGGCIGVDSVYVVTSSDPVANFNGVAAGTCFLDSTHFINTSSIAIASILTYSWDFGDTFFPTTDTSTMVDPVYLYSNQTNYNITLTATSELGCEKSITKSLVVHPLPVSDYTVSNGCSDSLISFTNNSTISSGFINNSEWFFGDGNTSTISSTGDETYNYSSDGTMTTKLVVSSNGCTDTLTKAITIHPNPVVAFSNNSACPNATIVFVNNSTISTGTLTYEWDFDDGSTSELSDPSYSYSTQGVKNVQLTAISAQNCRNSVIVPITVHDLPVPDFTMNNACQNQDVIFTNSSTMPGVTMTYQWRFGDGNTSIVTDPINVYTANGSYPAELVAISNEGCRDSISNTVTVHPLPNISFVTSGKCVDAEIEYTNTSSVLNGTLTYIWNFEDGVTTTTPNPLHTFATSGFHDVQLIASSNLGCVDSITNPVLVENLPVIGFSDTVRTCSDSYTLDAGNTGSSYLWSTGASTQNIKINYNSSFHVEVTSEHNCVQRDTTYLILNTPIAIDLGVDTTVCDHILLDSDLSGATYTWNTAETSETIDVTTTGQYWVSVIDQNNCISKDTINISVDSSSLFSFGPDITECIGETVVLNPNTVGSNYVWNTAENTQSINVTTNGDYWLELQNAIGCKSYDTVNVSFHQLPIVDLGLDASFCDSTVLNASSPGTTYNWNNGSTLDSLVVTTSGTYWVEVTAGGTACENRDTIQVIINKSPSLNLGSDTLICSYDELLLDADPNNLSQSYLWNSGETNNVRTVASTGTYGVRVTDINNCSQYDEIEVTLNPILIVDLGANFNLCQSAVATLESGIPNASYNWTYNSSSIGASENYIASEIGIYAVEVVDQYGCIAHDTIELYPTSLSLYAQYLAKTEVDIGDSLDFINLSYPDSFDSHWDFGDGNVVTEKSPGHVYYVDTTYYVKLTVTNGTCTDEMIKPIIVIDPTLKAPPLEGDDGDGPVKMIDFLSQNLYPNPNNGDFTLDLKLNKESEIEIVVYSIMGQIVYADDVVAKDLEKRISLNGLVSGMYILRARVNKKVRTIKFIKK